MEQKPVSTEEEAVRKILKETIIDVAKLEGDIKKLENRGNLDLIYKPPGFESKNNTQVSKDIKNLQSVIEDLKTAAVTKIDKIADELSPDKKDLIKKTAKESLYFGVPRKEALKNPDPSSTFMQSLNKSKFLQEPIKTLEKEESSSKKSDQKIGAASKDDKNKE